MSKNMSEFDRIESVVRLVVGRPISYLTFGILITGRWFYRMACRLANHLRHRYKPVSDAASR